MFSCEKVLIYIKLAGYVSAEGTIGGVQMHIKQGHDPIFTRCNETGEMTETVVRINVLKRIGHDFDFFKNVIEYVTSIETPVNLHLQ